MDLTVKIDTLEIQRKAILTLTDATAGLNAQISSLSSTWATEDAAFHTALGTANPNFTVESVALTNFWVGEIPSLMDASIDQYPAVSAIAYDADPKRSSDDVGENYTIRLLHEICVKGHTVAEVNYRIKRTLQAAHKVIWENLSTSTLGYTVPRINPPRETTGNAQMRREHHSRGAVWYWQGGTLQYSIDKYVDLS